VRKEHHGRPRRRTIEESDIRESDVLVVGHTHDAEIRAGRPLVVNPGECGDG